jgi:NAD(P)-dependent dehydrogenase (short-subunit alcohol dehydrogenase family)
VIGYPYNVAQEDETLGLIDEVLNSWGRLDVWVCSSGLLGPPSLQATTPADLQKCFEANSMAPFFALKYAPPAMAKCTPKMKYPNAVPKDISYGSIIVVSSVASTYGGMLKEMFICSEHLLTILQDAGVHAIR